jgi:hypothetical protein
MLMGEWDTLYVKNLDEFAAVAKSQHNNFLILETK